MRTISLKLPDELLAELEREAKTRRITKSVLVRESLEAALRGRPRRAASCYDLARDLEDCEGYAARPDGQSEIYGRFRRVRARVVSLNTGPLVAFPQTAWCTTLGRRSSGTLKPHFC
jgi:hypothetical protein